MRRSPKRSFAIVGRIRLATNRIRLPNWSSRRHPIILARADDSRVESRQPVVLRNPQSVAAGPPGCYRLGMSGEAAIDELLKRLAADASAARAMGLDLAVYLLNVAMLEVIGHADEIAARRPHGGEG